MIYPIHPKIKIREAIKFRDSRIQVSGWIHRIRIQSSSLAFIDVRDGTGFIQCVLQKNIVFIFKIF